MPLRSPFAWTGNVQTASAWLQAKHYPNIGGFFGSQDGLQAYFQGQLPLIGNAGTRRVLSKMLGRSGKLHWVASSSNPASVGHITPWGGTTRRSVAENLMQINCWEAVLYCAFQAEQITKAKCLNLYNAHFVPADPSGNIRSLFGAAAPFAVPGANPGDILTWSPGLVPGGAAPIINHVGIYVGQHVPTGVHYALHNLSLNAVMGYGMGGCIHFEPVNMVSGRYGAGGACFMNTPFWVPAAPTNAFYAAL